MQAAPELVATPAGGTLLLGGMLSFTTFTIGWLIFAAATFRARVFPRWMAVVLMAGALLAFGQGFPPLSALLAIAVGAMGVASLQLDPTQTATTATEPPAAQTVAAEG